MKIELHPAEHQLFLLLLQRAGAAQQKAQEATAQAQQYVAMLCEKAGVTMPKDANLQATKDDGKCFLEWQGPPPQLHSIPKRSVIEAEPA